MDVGRWLAGLGLAQYAASFSDNDIDGEVLAELSDADLKELGLSLGHRRKLLKALAALDPADTTGSTTAAPRPEAAAERRQLTVMFVDLVGSTALAGRLDPEEMREAITGYQNAVAGVVTRFEGHVAKYMGDGVLCYFGWPSAHEDDAERAVRAGFGIMQAMAGLAAPNGEPLSARAGIATGLVVVGDLIGEGAAQEEAVVGETPNLAARLQDLAAPGQIVLAGATRRLLGDLFEYHDLGRRELKGIAQPMRALAVLGERAAESRFAARQAGGLAEMVGREQELALLTERWRQARSGEGQMVLLSGEAGIGKSRITRALIDMAGADDHIRINYQCSPYHGESALYPATQQLMLAAGFAAEDSPDARLDKLEALLARASADIPAAAPLIAGLLGLGEAAEARHGTLGLSPQQRRARTLDALTAQLTSLARHRPVLFVLEDAHWIDPTTLELVELCLDHIAQAPVMMLITARPTFEQGFGGHPIVTRLALNRLGRAQIIGIVARMTKGKSLPDELLEEIAAKTDGVPLFVEELTKTVLESGALRETADAFVLDGPIDRLAIPSSLHDSLMARLDRQQPVKEVAQTAACVGREFGYRLLAAVSALSEPDLIEALDRLVEAELVFRRGVPPEARYSFKHALVRDAAYESLLKAKRRQIHGQLLGALEAAGDTAPELLAQHAGLAGESERAVTYWKAAGLAALARPAYEEAIGHFTNAIGLAQETGGDERSRAERELELQVQLAQALIARRGYGARPTAQAFARATTLVEALGETELRFPVFYGNWVGQYLRGEHAAAAAQAEQLTALADGQDDAVSKLMAHRFLGTSRLVMGRIAESRRHLEVALSHYRPEQHRALANRFGQEPGVAVHCYLALTTWALGHADRARDHMAEAERFAGALTHVNTACYLAVHECLYALCTRQVERLERFATTMSALAEEHGLSLWQVYSDACLGLTRATGGEVSGLEQFARAAAAYLSGGSRLFMPLLMTEQAKQLLRLGRAGDARIAIRDANAIMEATDERWAVAELHRVEGDLHLAQAQRAGAEACYDRAITVARDQGATAWQLRAAVSLASLWAEHGERQQALDLLSQVYESFTEGFDSPDLTDAKALLEALA